MAKAAQKTVSKKATKPRAATYDKPVTFNGSFDDMINISLTGAGAKKRIDIKKDNPSTKN